MRKLGKVVLPITTAIGFVVALGVTAAPAQAQATRTWISGVGDDQNPCSRTAPCRTWQGAMPNTAQGGEINCLDSGGFGAVTITKSITLRCVGDNGGVLVAGQNGIIINAPTTARVVLDGLDIEGLGASTTTPGINGVLIIQARDVVIRNTSIRHFGTAGVMVDATTKASVAIENSLMFNNGVGVRVQSASGNGTARVYDSQIIGSTTAGISVTGAGNLAEVQGSVVIRSPKGLEILSGGAINSYGDNVLTAGDAPTLVPTG